MVIVFPLLETVNRFEDVFFNTQVRLLVTVIVAEPDDGPTDTLVRLRDSFGVKASSHLAIQLVASP